MNVSTPIPSTVELVRSRLVGLMAIVAALAATITWALLVFVVDTGAERAGTEPFDPPLVYSFYSPSVPSAPLDTAAPTSVLPSGPLGYPSVTSEQLATVAMGCLFGDPAQPTGPLGYPSVTSEQLATLAVRCLSEGQAP
jgi:hypothetical protein